MDGDCEERELGIQPFKHHSVLQNETNAVHVLKSGRGGPSSKRAHYSPLNASDVDFNNNYFDKTVHFDNNNPDKKIPYSFKLLLQGVKQISSN